jgi:hypothetical protein
LARNVSDCPGVLIAELDVSLYEVPGLPIVAYPTIYLFRYNQKFQLLEFDDGYPRLVDNFYLFLREVSPQYRRCLKDKGLLGDAENNGAEIAAPHISAPVQV